MSAYIFMDEAERMINKIKEIGKYHQNTPFLAREISSDLSKAQIKLTLEPAADREAIKKRIESLRKQLNDLDLNRKS